MEIRDYKEHNPNDKTLAEFDIYIPAIDTIYRRWKLVRTKKGSIIPVGPAYSEGQDPNKKWLKYVEVGSRFKEGFEKTLREALKPFVRHEGF